MHQDRQRAIARIRKMEAYFDTARQALWQGIPPTQPLLRAMLQALSDYQSSGRWLQDYERDERGELPPGLKRGVLAQDALYDLLQSVK